MIHYFNPGHETAVLNRSQYYQAAARQVKMQEDLALLPAWYAKKKDWVYLGKDSFMQVSEVSNRLLSSDPMESLTAVTASPGLFTQEAVDLWGISPQAIHLFQGLSKRYDWELQIPTWSEELRSLSSRTTARDSLLHLIKDIPEVDPTIVPNYHSTLEEIEEVLLKAETRQVLKSPYSSSGRGLLWLPTGELGRSERQIISGMLKKQGEVSLEPALDKVMDFSMHFDLSDEKAVFLGYSLFSTNVKGAYEKSFLLDQADAERQVTAYIPSSLLERVKENILPFLRENYLPHYSGKLGVDMLIYRGNDSYRLHPCVEINMRKSMGFLSLEFYRQHVEPGRRGAYVVDYASAEGELLSRHQQMQKEYPLLIQEGVIQSGYLSLCPVSPTTNYRAYVLID